MGWKTTPCAQTKTRCFVCETRFIDSIGQGTQASWYTHDKVGDRGMVVDWLPSLFLFLVTSLTWTAARRQGWNTRRCARCCLRCQRCCHRHCFGCRSTNCHQETPRKTCWHRRYRAGYHWLQACTYVTLRLQACQVNNYVTFPLSDINRRLYRARHRRTQTLHNRIYSNATVIDSPSMRPPNTCIQTETAPGKGSVWGAVAHTTWIQRRTEVVCCTNTCTLASNRCCAVTCAR